MRFFEVNFQAQSVTGTKRKLKWGRRGSPHAGSAAVSFWGSRLLTPCTYCRSACSMPWYRSPPATPERAGERSWHSFTLPFMSLPTFHILPQVLFVYWILFHSYFSPPAAFSSVSFEVFGIFVSTSLNLCVTLLWLENPQIPAATSMANKISRKKKNCTVDKTKRHLADGGLCLHVIC